MPKNIAACFARSTRPGNLFGAQHQHSFDGLSTYFVDHAIHCYPRFGDQIHQWQQELPVSSGELFYNGGARFRIAPNDMVRFLHGGGAPFLDWFLAKRF